MPYITIEEEVWVDLDDFETEDLVEELKRRKATTSVSNWTGPNGNELVNEIYMAKHVRHQPYEHLVDELIGTVLGKIV
jgi:hypothetical protein